MPVTKSYSCSRPPANACKRALCGDIFGARVAVMTTDESKVVLPDASEVREGQTEPPRYNVLRMCSGMQHYPFLNSVDSWTDKYLLGGEVSKSFWTGDDKKTRRW